mmetsp:Transcript_117566/g.285255  ORF Transcript_117566/g.285255 Transcript_117566/m.285255 type:complete len:352 (-) Transcript_117566:387-1442(-)
MEWTSSSSASSFQPPSTAAQKLPTFSERLARSCRWSPRPTGQATTVADSACGHQALNSSHASPGTPPRSLGHSGSPTSALGLAWGPVAAKGSSCTAAQPCPGGPSVDAQATQTLSWLASGAISSAGLLPSATPAASESQKAASLPFLSSFAASTAPLLMARRSRRTSPLAAFSAAICSKFAFFPSEQRPIRSSPPALWTRSSGLVAKAAASWAHCRKTSLHDTAGVGAARCSRPSPLQTESLSGVCSPAVHMADMMASESPSTPCALTMRYPLWMACSGWLAFHLAAQESRATALTMSSGLVSKLSGRTWEASFLRSRGSPSSQVTCRDPSPLTSVTTAGFRSGMPRESSL